MGPSSDVNRLPKVVIWRYNGTDVPIEIRGDLSEEGLQALAEFLWCHRRLSMDDTNVPASNDFRSKIFRKMNTSMFGSHLSIAGGLHNALLSAEQLGMDTVQVFTKNWPITDCKADSCFWLSFGV